MILVVCLASWCRFDLFERLERITFDVRVRVALRFAPVVSANLGFSFIDEESVRRPVKLANRIEGISRCGQICISQSTYERLQHGATALAATCVPLGPANVKGIRSTVEMYEVPLREAGSPDLDDEFPAPDP